MSDKKWPTPEDIQREFEQFVKQRFGSTMQMFTNQMNSQPNMHSDEDEAESTVGDDHTFPGKFNLKPKEVKAYLDRFIIKQDEAKKALAIAVCDHYHHVKASLEGKIASDEEYAKQNVLLIGPTGVGKTYMIRKIADLIGVPFVKADATRFSETGYVGANVDDMIRDLVAQADGDVEKAQYGIVYLDEADKLATPPQSAMGRDVNGRGVQFGLLRLMEETEVDLRAGNDLQSQMQALMDFSRKGKSKHVVNTGKILFIVSGAFSGLTDLISKRLNTNAIGFEGQKRRRLADADMHMHASTEDFVAYGFEPEFIGRLPVRVHCLHLDEDDLLKILKESRGSIIHQYVRAFEHYGIELDFTEDALREISRLAHREKTGARGLMTVCERVLRPFKFELPSTQIKKLIITADIVQNPAGFMADFLAKESELELMELTERIKEFEEDFRAQFQMNIAFSREAKNALARLAEERQVDVKALCADLLQSYEHGLKLIQKNTGQEAFHLPIEVVREPQNYLEKLIRQSFKSPRYEQRGLGESLE